MTRYTRGRNFEYRVRDDMARRGYVTVRSPASKTPADVYCIGIDSKVFVQCKTGGRLAASEWNEFFDFCWSVDAVPVLAETGENGRGIRYHRLLDRKTGRGRQPMEDYEPPKGGRREVQESQGRRNRVQDRDGEPAGQRPLPAPFQGRTS